MFLKYINIIEIKKKMTSVDLIHLFRSKGPNSANFRRDHCASIVIKIGIVLNLM